VRQRRQVFAWYEELLGDLEGLTFMPEAEWGTSTRWLTCMLLDEQLLKQDITPERIRLALEQENIEARPIWKPLHLQPVYEGFPMYGGEVAEDLFKRGLCLPSGSAMSKDDVERVTDVIRLQVES
jgi:dTDP-4-amino-4,6-dideoxygalactose transaminase